MPPHSDSTLDDFSIRRLASVVHYVPDDECEAIYPSHFPTIARVTLADGSRVEEKVLANLGTAERPLTPEQVRLKFDLNVRILGPERAAALSARLDGIAAAADANQLLAGIDW